MEKISVERDWESLPGTALVQIFKNLGLLDRLLGGPLVCRAWNHASKDPRCWESMLPLNVSLEDFFIKNPHQFRHFQSFTMHQFQSFIERSNGRVTTLFLSAVDSNFEEDDTLTFIADRCPHLKHLSLRGFWEEKSVEGFLKVMMKCKELELLDVVAGFSFSAATVEEMGRCWPHLRGLRWSGYIDYLHASAIATSFPQLRLLNFSESTLYNRSLYAIIKGCSALQFLNVTHCHYLTIDKDIRERSAHIRDFCFDEKDGESKLFNACMDPNEYHIMVRGERDDVESQED